MLECSYQETQRYGSGTYVLSNKTYCNDQCTMLLSPSFIMAMFSKDKNQLTFATRITLMLLGPKELSAYSFFQEISSNFLISVIMSRKSVVLREWLKRKKKAAKDVIISRSASAISLNCS